MGDGLLVWSHSCLPCLPLGCTCWESAHLVMGPGESLKVAPSSPRARTSDKREGRV